MCVCVSVCVTLQSPNFSNECRRGSGRTIKSDEMTIYNGLVPHGATEGEGGLYHGLNEGQSERLSGGYLNGECACVSVRE